MTTHGQSHGPFELWGALASGPIGGVTSGRLGPHRITAVRVHQTSDHVDGVQFRFDGEAFHGTAGRSGKPTAVVTLELDEDEDITSIKLTFANEMMWAKSLEFTTSKGRVVDSGDAYINEKVDVVVTRVLQTAAGCIIFAQPKRS